MFCFRGGWASVPLCLSLGLAGGGGFVLRRVYCVVVWFLCVGSWWGYDGGGWLPVSRVELDGCVGDARYERRVVASLDYGLWNLVAVEVVAPQRWRELEGLRLNGRDVNSLFPCRLPNGYESVIRVLPVEAVEYFVTEVAYTLGRVPLERLMDARRVSEFTVSQVMGAARDEANLMRFRTQSLGSDPDVEILSPLGLGSSVFVRSIIGYGRDYTVRPSSSVFHQSFIACDGYAPVLDQVLDNVRNASRVSSPKFNSIAALADAGFYYQAASGVMPAFIIGRRMQR